MNVLNQAVRALRPFDTASQGWSHRDAAHLLWRTRFGASFQEIQNAKTEGLEDTLDRLFAIHEESPEFQSSNRLLRQMAIDTGNINHLKAWWLHRMMHSENPLAVKMSFLWHNHFATSNAKVRSVEHMGAQNDLIRTHALGSFRDLLLGMTRDVAMLIWLDSNSNRKRQANENFAREVMELFSLGVGNYTEDDIKEAARAFTGWHVRDEAFWFNKRQHDFQKKTLLGRTDNLDGADVIETCLAQSACPQFLAGKLLRAFVMPAPDEDTVNRLAGRIRAHDFQIKPVLRELFGSRLFFSHPVRHAIIKSPLDLVLGTYRTLRVRPNLQNTARLLADLGQDIFQPPSVKGWEGGRLWINSATLLQRANFAAELTNGSRIDVVDESNSEAEALNSKTLDKIVRYFTDLLLARDLEECVLNKLTGYLDSAKGDRSTRIRGTIHLIMSMPEYQLM